MQGTRVWSLVWEDPTCCWATKCLCCNYWESVAKIKMLQDSMKILCVTPKTWCSQLNKPLKIKKKNGYKPILALVSQLTYSFYFASILHLEFQWKNLKNKGCLLLLSLSLSCCLLQFFPPSRNCHELLYTHFPSSFYVVSKRVANLLIKKGTYAHSSPWHICPYNRPSKVRDSVTHICINCI